MHRHDEGSTDPPHGRGGQHVPALAFAEAAPLDSVLNLLRKDLAVCTETGWAYKAWATLPPAAVLWEQVLQ